MKTSPGTLKAVNINFISATNASGILTAQQRIRYILLGWELTVPSGTIGISFDDGAGNVTGIRQTTVDSPWVGGPMLPIIVNRPLRIKVDKPVNALKGSIWYMEEEQYKEQTTNLKTVKVGPNPAL